MHCLLWFPVFLMCLTLCLSGFPRKFLQESGLLASGLGGSLARNRHQAGGDNEEDCTPKDDAAEEPDVPFAEEPPPAAAPAPQPACTIEEELEDLTENLSKFSIHTTSEMQIKAFHLLDVAIQGDVVDTADILGVQVRPTPGTILNTLLIAPRSDDPSQVDVSGCLHHNVSNGMARTREKWADRDRNLTKRIGQALQSSCDEDAVSDSEPKHEVDTDSFVWPDGLKSQLIPIDPWKIGLRSHPVRQGRALYEIDTVNLGTDAKAVVPCSLVTVFFMVEKPRHTRGLGDLRLSGSEDSEDGSGVASPGKRPRQAAAPPRKPPKSSLFGFATFGLFG